MPDTASSSSTRRSRAEVVVIGAGLAGLTAAWRLRQQGVHDVRVLEARDRVGGRTLTEQQPGSVPLDLGAQWVGPSQTRVLALAQEMGIDTFPSPAGGRHIMLMDGRRHVYRGLFPLRQSRVGFDFVAAATRLELLARRIDAHDPWSCAKALDLDALSFGDWLRQHLKTPQARTLFEIASGLTMGGDPDELSLLWVLHHLKGAGGWAPLLSVKGGAQDRRFVQGAQSVSTRLAERLSPCLSLAQPVRRVAWHEGGVQVHCDGEVIEARRVIVAMSPVDRQRISFEPALPAPVAQLNERMTLFKGIKVQLVYGSPFWRKQGLSGQALSDSGIAPVTFDNSHPERPQGVLVAFVAGKTGPSAILPSERELGDENARRDAVVACMVRYFGEEARHPLAYVEKDWRDEAWSSGCIPAMQPGVLTQTGAQAGENVGPIIWAGTEMAERWGGYMDGAVRSGEHAAAQVVAH